MDELWDSDLDAEILGAARIRAPKIFQNLDVEKMISHGGFTFNVSSCDNEEDYHDEVVPDGQVKDFFDEDECNFQALRSEFVNRPYKDLVQEMEQIHKFVHKKIVKKGKGDRIVGENDTVLVDYQTFTEGRSCAIDSTENSHTLQLRVTRGPYPGFCYSLLSMKVGEVAYFLVNHNAAFGELGCQPRIAPNQDILLEIELHEILDVLPDFNESDTFFPWDKLSQALRLRDEAKHAFQRGHLSQCLQKYKEGLKLLESMDKDEDEKENQKKDSLALTLHVNLAIVYNKLCKPSDALVQCGEVLRADPDNEKALLHKGRALASLKRDVEAREVLLSGCKLYPTNKAFQAELKKTERKGN